MKCLRVGVQRPLPLSDALFETRPSEFFCQGSLSPSSSSSSVTLPCLPWGCSGDYRHPYDPSCFRRRPIIGIVGLSFGWHPSFYLQYSSCTCTNKGPQVQALQERSTLFIIPIISNTNRRTFLFLYIYIKDYRCICIYITLSKNSKNWRVCLVQHANFRNYRRKRNIGAEQQWK